MTGEIRATPAKLVIAMRYRNVAAATEWLTATFGFEKQHIVAADDGTIAVAHLSVGDSIIMLLPVGGTELDRLMKQPDEIGGAETQSCYLVVEEADLLYAKVKAVGAEFVLDLKQYASGGHGFSCRDPEGHIWSFGTYDPWEGKSLGKDRLSVGKPLPSSKRRSALTMATMAVIAVAIGAAGWILATVQHSPPNADEMRLKHELVTAQERVRQIQLTEDRRAKAAERAVKEAQGAQETAEHTARQMETQLTEERRAKEAAERAVKEAQGAQETAEQTARQMETQLTEERRAKEAAERAVKEAQSQLGRGQDAEKSVAEPPRQLAPIGELFSLEDMKRVAALADEKRLPLPPIRIRKPTADVPESMRRFVGIWVSDSDFEKTGRQYMLIVTNVLPTGQAVGFHVVGPPQHASTLPSLPTRAGFFAFVGRISGNELLIKSADGHIVGKLSSGNELNITEAWKKDLTRGHVVLKPVWLLTDAERTTKP